MTISTQQSCPWDLFEKTFGKLRNGSTGELRGAAGKSYRVRLHEWERVGDECVFRFDILDESSGNA